MIVVALVLVAGLVAWLGSRRARARTLAGLNGDRPTFMVGPPSRRLSSRKVERL